MIETKRLILQPLTASQMELWVTDIPALETELGILYQGDVMGGRFLEIVKEQLGKVRSNPENALFCTFWMLITKDMRTAVGSADFKDPPNSKGQLEIGYGISDAFQNRGYATEAVAAMCQWALSQPGVQEIIAETLTDNPASARVLQKCGMRLSRQVSNSLWWRL